MSNLPWAPWLRKHGAVVRLAACFLSVGLASVFVGLAPEANLIWVANGVLLAYLLLAPRKRWTAYLCVGFAALVAGSLVVNPHWPMTLLLAVLNLAEVLISALLLRTRSSERPRFTDRAYLIRFIGFAVVAAPLAIGLVFALIMVNWLHAASGTVFLRWAAADGLGTGVATPACVAIFRTRLINSSRSGWDWIYPPLVAVTAIAAFSQTRVPLIYFIYPLLLLVLFRLGLGCAAMATLLVAAVGSWYTLRGQGPFALAASLTQLEQSILLQVFLAVGMAMLYSVSVVLEKRRAIERRLEKIASLHALVTENSRDAIMLADFNGQRSYASAAVERMIGWPLKEFVRINVLDLVHPEDRPRAEAVVEALHAGAEGAMIECRVSKYTGGYIWVEASARIVSDPKTGAPYGILNIVRDITERKQFEESRAFHHSLIRAIYEVSLEGILVVNNEGKIVSYNNRFADVWKIPRPDFPSELNEESTPIIDELMLSEVANRVKDREAFLTRVRALYADPNATDQCEILLNDGRTLERYSTSVRSENGNHLGRVWFFRDISERKSAEAKLQDAYKTVETLASTDSLTGLANRRRFDQVLHNEWRRGLREQRPLSLLMIDADLFKSYNDTYGHPRGDSCLKQIAEAAEDVAARPGDLVARFGGEEFAVILPNTGSSGALKIAQEICDAMRVRALPHAESSLGIMTVSVGCATLVPALGLHAVNLIELADEALYKAKRAGRNRVCGSDPIDGGPAEPRSTGQIESIRVKTA
jgi:diguanylate cyclase (GGDEF)-like protein/PAS domain S-box-containing protein